MLTLGNLQKQELHKPRYWRLLDELEGRHVSQLTLTQFTFDDNALFDQLLKATSNNLRSLDISWCSFPKAEQFAAFAEALLASTSLKSLNISYLNTQAGANTGPDADDFL